MPSTLTFTFMPVLTAPLLSSNSWFYLHSPKTLYCCFLKTAWLCALFTLCVLSKEVVFVGECCLAKLICQSDSEGSYRSVDPPVTDYLYWWFTDPHWHSLSNEMLPHIDWLLWEQFMSCVPKNDYDGGGFFLACEDLERMFDRLFSTCVFLFFFF